MMYGLRNIGMWFAGWKKVPNNIRALNDVYPLLENSTGSIDITLCSPKTNIPGTEIKKILDFEFPDVDYLTADSFVRKDGTERYQIKLRRMVVNRAGHSFDKHGKIDIVRPTKK